MSKITFKKEEVELSTGKFTDHYAYIGKKDVGCIFQPLSLLNTERWNWRINYKGYNIDNENDVPLEVAKRQVKQFIGFIESVQL